MYYEKADEAKFDTGCCGGCVVCGFDEFFCGTWFAGKGHGDDSAHYRWRYIGSVYQRAYDGDRKASAQNDAEKKRTVL